MAPSRSDYDYSPGDDRNDWLHKNVDKLQAIYDGGGSQAINAEWYKFRMADSTKDIHQISKDEADEIVYDSPYVTQSLYDGWFRNADSSYKPKLTNAIVSTPEMRNAALNLAYENYRQSTEEPLSFEEFLITPVKMYRGDYGQKKLKDDVFDAYTFDRKTAEHFASKGENGEVFEIEARPIDTYGSMRAVGEAEIWVPRELAHRKNTDSVEEDDGWDWKDPVRWYFEDRALGIVDDEPEFDLNEELIDSIVRDAEMIELFAKSKGEADKNIAERVISRCIDGIQRAVGQITAMRSAANGDSAFFAGELDENLGEKEKLYPEHVEAFRERRQKRLDAKKEEPAAWITVNGNHIPVDEEGNPMGGQEKALGKTAYAGSSEKRRISQKIDEIVKSDDSSEIKTQRVAGLLSWLPKGSEIEFPDSWTSDDGYKNRGIREEDGKWLVKYGRGKDDHYRLSDDEMAGYMISDDESERPKITKVPDGSTRKKPDDRQYALNRDGSIDGRFTSGFTNSHVDSEERKAFKKDIQEEAFAQRGFDNERSLYRKEANAVGDKVEAEIRRRAALRKKDKVDAPVNDYPQVEDIYDVLRDVRDFGMPESFKPDVYSDLPEEKTREIIKEATERFPTDWFKDCDTVPQINIVEGSGRAHCTNGRFITVYTKMDWGEGKTTDYNDRGLVNVLAHELGHFMEANNKKVGLSVDDVFYQRVKDDDGTVDVEPGYKGYKDHFFDTYMGKVYGYTGGIRVTEVLSCLMENIGAFNPFQIMQGRDYSLSTGKYGRKVNDKESLGYILGVLAGL